MRTMKKKLLITTAPGDAFDGREHSEPDRAVRLPCDERPVGATKQGISDANLVRSGWRSGVSRWTSYERPARTLGNVIRPSPPWPPRSATAWRRGTGPGRG